MIILLTNLSTYYVRAEEQIENKIDDEIIDTDMINEEKQYMFSGEEVLELANIMADLMQEIEYLEKEVDNLEQQVLERDNLIESLKQELGFKDEVINKQEEKIVLLEEVIEDKDQKFEQMVEQTEKTISLQEDSIEDLEEAIEYYKEASGISLTDRIQWVLIGAGFYSIVNSVF